MIPLETARSRLATVWFGSSAVLFIILVGQSLGGLFGDQMEKAWAWALPNIAPTLSLMISVFAAYALVADADVDKQRVRVVFFRLSFALSIFYVLNLIIVIVAAPLAVYHGGVASHPVDVLHAANFWLGPLQGFTAAALAALFFTKTDSHGAVNETARTLGATGKMDAARRPA